MATKSTMALRNATDLAKRLGVGIELVEEITRCLEEVHPMLRNESTERERIALDETHGFPVSRGAFVGNKIDALDNCV
jgi:glutaredoxin 2